jgi:predicted MFS family arabinose efflux permease
VSVFLPLEHSLLARESQGRERTAQFARYSVVGSLAGACGALAAAAPSLLAATAQLDERASLQAMFVAYAGLALAAAMVYRRLPSHAAAPQDAPRAALGRSRKRVYALAALFSLDAFAGGLVVQSLLALWLYQRFGLSLEAAGTLFFWCGLLAAFSFVVAARIAGRIGLVDTMVFTHIPASLCLLAVPFVHDLAWAVGLLLVRSALSQMDVPTRSSYVMAIVTPPERPAAASVTTVPRSLAAATSPAIAGWLMTVSPFGWPLVACAVLKIAYDLLLLAMFRRVRPPEEDAPAPAPAARA